VDKFEQVSVRLVKEAPLMSSTPIGTPEDAIALVGDMLCEMDREVLCVINMKTDGKPINFSIVSIGAINQSLAEPRELFKTSILSNAASLIMVHNHVSGSLVPSQSDIIVTDKMVQLSNFMGIPLLDHIIVGGENKEYFSFKGKDVLPVAKGNIATDYHDIDFGTGEDMEKLEGIGSVEVAEVAENHNIDFTDTDNSRAHHR